MNIIIVGVQTELNLTEHEVEVTMMKAENESGIEEITELPQSEVLLDPNPDPPIRSKRDLDCDGGIHPVGGIPRMKLCLRKRKFSELSVFEDSFDTLNVTIYGSGLSKATKRIRSLENLHFYGGNLIPHDGNGNISSAVDGIVLNGVFFGKVRIGDDLYFVDPEDSFNGTNIQRITKFQHKVEKVDQGTGY